MVKIRKKKEKDKKGAISPRDRDLTLGPRLSEFDRIFDDFRNSFENMLWSPFWGRFGRRGPGLRFREDFLREPELDLIDKGQEFLLKAELPGISKDEVDIEVSRDRIEIKAERKEEKEERDEEECYLCQERSYSSFYRSLALPEEIVPDKVKAELKNGILEIKLPKEKPTEKPEKKKVKVQ